MYIHTYIDIYIVCMYNYMHKSRHFHIERHPYISIPYYYQSRFKRCYLVSRDIHTGNIVGRKAKQGGVGIQLGSSRLSSPEGTFREFHAQGG